MKRVLALGLGMIPWLAMANAPAPNDFAYGFELHTPGQGAVYQISLPDRVYRELTRNDLADIRVFNAANMPVPHILKHEENVRQIEIPEWAPPFFPIYRQPGNSEKSMSVQISTDSQGTIVEFEQDAPKADNQPITGYLFDLSQVADIPARIELRWPADSGDFIIPVRIEYSNDLNRWRLLESNTTLANMRYGGHRLLNNVVELPAMRYRYLRLQSGSDKAFPELSSASLHFSGREDELPLKWLQVQGRVSDAQGEYLFDTGGRFPLERVNLKLSQRNAMMNATLMSRPNPQSTWRRRATGNIYNLAVDDETLSNPDFRVRLTGDRYWKLVVNGDQTLHGGMPVLAGGWRPHQLVFVAQPPSPYHLAFGSAVVDMTKFPVHSLLREIQERHSDLGVTDAQVGAFVKLGDRGRLQKPPEGLPWKRIVLWIILVLVVMLLAWMAYRLYRQMQQPDSERQQD